MKRFQWVDPFESNVQALSLFRIIFGTYLLLNLVIVYVPLIPIFYLESGYNPLSVFHAYTQHNNQFFRYATLFQLSGNSFYIYTLFAVYGCALVGLILGCYTNICKIIVTLLYISICNRNDFLNSGAENISQVLLIWSLFVPLERYWSVDAALTGINRQEKVPRILMAGIKIQIALIYFMSGAYKLLGDTWINGQSIMNVMHDGIHGTEHGRAFFYEYPWLATYGTYAVFIFQLSFTFLLYSPIYNVITRSLAILGAFFLHLGFLIFMNLGAFPLICMTYLMLLVPDQWWNHFFSKRRARLEKIEIFYDPDCGVCRKISLLFREFCLSPHSFVRPADSDPEIYRLLQEHNSWVVYDKQTDTKYLKWIAVAFVLKQNILTYPIGFLTDFRFIKPMLEKFYEWIGRQRQSLGYYMRMLPSSSSRLPQLYPQLSVIASLMIIIMLAINISGYLKNAMPTSYVTAYVRNVTVIFNFLQIRQNWAFFAPNVMAKDVSVSFVGISKEGSQRTNLNHIVYNGWEKWDYTGYAPHVSIPKMKLIDAMASPYYESLYRYALKKLCQTGKYEEVMQIYSSRSYNLFEMSSLDLDGQQKNSTGFTKTLSETCQ